MALTSTVYNLDVSFADADRGVYEDLALRVALHPSETLEFMHGDRGTGAQLVIQQKPAGHNAVQHQIDGRKSTQAQVVRFRDASFLQQPSITALDQRAVPQPSFNSLSRPDLQLPGNGYLPHPAAGQINPVQA